MQGLYIHIPFCASRCIYCGFYSTTLIGMQDRYVEALCKEMELRNISGKTDTVYMGGGTPSQLTTDNLNKLLAHINNRCEGMQEITMECNPDDVMEEFADTIRELPVNRISMGAQTFDDKRLRFLQRRHTVAEVKEAVRRLRQAGIGNISIDLMFGFPGETLDEWKHDIDEALALEVEHISAYSLMIENGTPLYQMIHHEKDREETIELPSDELFLQMYEVLMDKLAKGGYEHYEISNFAREGFRSLHNSNYWNATPYHGIGAAAHSYDGNSRSWNIPDVVKYMEAIEGGKLNSECELLDDDTKYNDLITTALRTREGINLGTLKDKYRRYLTDNAKRHIEDGTMRAEGDFIHLTRKGLFICDRIMSDLIYLE